MKTGNASTLAASIVRIVLYSLIASIILGAVLRLFGFQGSAFFLVL